MTNTISRRRFIAGAASSIAAARLGAQGRSAAQATLAVPAEATGARMPANFVGLSYEVQQLADPNFFSERNGGLIREFRALAARGVLRLGGNTSDFAEWKPTAASPEPQHPQVRAVEGEPNAQFYAVSAEAVRNLARFLEATGWTCIYGINLGTNTPEQAAAEAGFAAKTLGAKLEYFQIGNEADLFGWHLRDAKTWSEKAYLKEWLQMARAITAAVPGAKFGLPDVASNMQWLTGIADAWPAIQNAPQVVALTHHYYFGGPATNPAVNIPNLLSPAAMTRVQKMADVALAAAAKMDVNVRMTEGNTCYRGGKPGVSDVFAAALWAADYSLLLASNHYTGVNLHGGTGKSVANSVGGVLPGDTLLKEQGATLAEIATHPHPFYTPIATFGSEYVMEPVGYGLKFAGALSGGRFFESDFTAMLQAVGVNATAYAVKLASGQTSVIVLNKGPERDLALNLDFGTGKSGEVETETLHAPALDSRKAQITRPARPLRAQNGKCTVTVPRATGMRLTLS
jgi:hypothetical protein